MKIKKRLKEFYDVRVVDREDRKMFICGVFLLAAAITIAIYDLATIINGTVNANAHIPFLYAIGLAAISVIILMIL